MTKAAVRTTAQDVNQVKYKWSGFSTRLGSSLGDWAYVADTVERTTFITGNFASTVSIVIWEGSLNGNTSDAVAIPLHDKFGVQVVASTDTVASIYESIEYIRPSLTAGSSVSSIDAYFFGRMAPR